MSFFFIKSQVNNRAVFHEAGPCITGQPAEVPSPVRLRSTGLRQRACDTLIREFACSSSGAAWLLLRGCWLFLRHANSALPLHFLPSSPHGWVMDSWMCCRSAPAGCLASYSAGHANASLDWLHGNRDVWSELCSTGCSRYSECCCRGPSLLAADISPAINFTGSIHIRLDHANWSDRQFEFWFGPEVQRTVSSARPLIDRFIW